jgi:cytochrome P450
VIAERRAGLRSDFLADLVQARDQGDKLTNEELFGMIFGLFGALAATSRSRAARSTRSIGIPISSRS